MSFDIKDVKTLRERTGAGVLDCKKALTEAEGNMSEAEDYLKKRAKVISEKRGGRATREGFVGHYVHANGKIGVLVELNCETDFVARNDDFRELARNLAMHVAGTPYEPVAVERDDVPEDVVEEQKDVFAEQMRNEDKPEHIIEQIVEGKLDKWYQQVVLMEQPYVKDPDKPVREIIQEAVGRIGENITIGRFSRLEVGEEDEPADDE